MNLLKLITKISMMTFLSRIFGFIRDTLIVRIFGTNAITDAFFVAFKIPNLLRNIFAEGAFCQSFIPILTEYKNKKNKKFIQLFISHIAGKLILIILLLSIFGVIFSSYIIKIFAPGFLKNIYLLSLSSSLLKIIFPYLFFISISSMMSAILQVWNYFFIPSLCPIFLNISIIFFSLFFSSYFNPPIFALAWSIIIGGIIQFIYQIIYLKKINMLVFPNFSLKNFYIINVIHRMKLVILGISANQFTLIINNIYASFLIPGSISWMYYASRLIELPCGILGITISTVLLPSLTKHISCGKKKEHVSILNWSFKICLLLSIPSTIVLIILAKPFIIVLFQYGKFTQFDVVMTSNALIANSIGVIGFMMVKIFTSAFYSCKNTKTPMKISIFCFIFIQLLNPFLIKYLKHVGISLSIGLHSCINASLLYWKLYKKKIFKPELGWNVFFLHLFISLFIMIITIVIINYWIIISWNIGNFFYKIFRLCIVCIIASVSYCLSLYFLGFKWNNILYKDNKNIK